jgi:hypothetical protein
MARCDPRRWPGIAVMALGHQFPVIARRARLRSGKRDPRGTVIGHERAALVFRARAPSSAMFDERAPLQHGYGFRKCVYTALNRGRRRPTFQRNEPRFEGGGSRLEFAPQLRARPAERIANALA